MSQAPTIFDVFLALPELVLLVTAFRITTHGTVKGVIGSYRVQSFLLAFITGITVLKRWIGGEQEVSFVLIVLIVLLPVLLGGSIEYLLARATVTVPGALFTLDKPQRHIAERVWLRQGGSRISFLTAVFFLGLLAIASGITFLAIPREIEFALPERIGLLVSLSLYLTGLYNTAVKGDIITQVIGLLTMDHGLYLAIVKIVAIPGPATFFVVGLYFYTLITIAILVFILPQVRRETESVDLEEIARSSELNG